jgi:DNA-binding response OmpR family regulator
MNKTRILIVDDDPKISNLVQFFLERTNRFIVRVENRSSQACAAARDFLPEMALLDVDMPGKDGGEVAAELMQEPAMKGLQIVFLTSLISLTDAGENSVMRGGMRFLAKPVSPKVLIDTVDRVMGRIAQAA